MAWNSGYEQSCASVCFLQQTKPNDVSHYFPLYKTLRTSFKKKKKNSRHPINSKRRISTTISHETTTISNSHRNLFSRLEFVAPRSLLAFNYPHPRRVTIKKKRNKEKGEAKTSRGGRRSSDRRPKFHHRRIPGGAVFVIRVRIAIPIDARSWLHTG